ncbi:MAG: hypothetical protein M3327_10480 [Actinomycetota bacterium]|nr:hypothetical protein [Actinomycetota bacterium]
MTTTATERLPPTPRETSHGRYTVATLGLMAIATTNGIVRERTYGKVMGERAAHALSLVPMVALFGVYTNALERRWPLPTWQGALGIGATWAGIAAGFELGVGHFVDRKPWSQLLGEYNPAAGRTGGLVLLASAAMPALVRLWRTSSTRGGRRRR